MTFLSSFVLLVLLENSVVDILDLLVTLSINDFFYFLTKIK